jgi:hypothetical protein
VNFFFALHPVKRCTDILLPGKKTVRGITYLDMLREWLTPQLQEDNDNFILVQNGAPPHWHIEVRNYLHEK